MKVLPVTQSHTFKDSYGDNKKKEAVFDAINILDTKAQEQVDINSKAYKTISVLYLLPVIFCTAFFPQKVDIRSKEFLQKASKTIAGISAVTLGTMGLYTYNRAKDESISTENGYYKALNEDLSDIRSFAELNENQSNQIESDRDYKIAEYRNYTQHADIFNNVNVVKSFETTRLMKQNLKENQEVFDDRMGELKKQAETPSRQAIRETLTEIDSKSDKYKKGVLQGFYLILGLTSLVATAGASMMNKFAEKSKNAEGSTLLKWLIGICAVLPPILTIGRENFQDINEIARYKAKKDIRENKESSGLKNYFAYITDYMRNKNSYLSNITKQNRQLSIKNDLKKDIEYSSKQLEDAKKQQEDFFVGSGRYIDDNNIKTKTKKYGLCQDFILNVITFPVSIMIMLGIINKNPKESVKQIRNGSAIITGGILANLLLTELLFAGKSKSN